MGRYSTANLENYRQDPTCFGGALAKSHPKTARPFRHYQALHMVMRASVARGKLSMLQPARRRKIQNIVKRQAQRFGVRVRHFANSGNHLHLLVMPPRDRAAFTGFTKAIAGLIARATLNVERGCPRGIKFWDLRPFSRVIPSGRSYVNCYRYVSRNVLEALGFEELDLVLADLKTWKTGPPRSRRPKL